MSLSCGIGRDIAISRATAFDEEYQLSQRQDPIRVLVLKGIGGTLYHGARLGLRVGALALRTINASLRTIWGCLTLGQFHCASLDKIKRSWTLVGSSLIRLPIGGIQIAMNLLGCLLKIVGYPISSRLYGLGSQLMYWTNRIDMDFDRYELSIAKERDEAMGTYGVPLLQRDNEFEQREFEQLFPGIPFEQLRAVTDLLNIQEAGDLIEFLRVLSRSSDFEDSPARMIRGIRKMLDCAASNVDFRDAVKELWRQGSVTCTDRGLLYFADIEILMGLHSGNQKNPREFAAFCVRVERYERLKKYAEENAATLQNRREAVETILYHLLMLKERLNLPISIETMDYSRCASGIGEDDELLKRLCAEAGDRVEEFRDIELLTDSNHWREYLYKSYPDYRAAKDEILDWAVDQVTNHIPPELNSQGVQIFCRRTEHEREFMIQDLTNRHTEAMFRRSRTIQASVGHETERPRITDLSHVAGETTSTFSIQ